uniref:Uncharacterized protein n=1 Tax=Mycena chlorophos TaxID=658473 RepID=A0ABQ0LVD6_MYCCL|nr:predicted protein [Mycena chlorophos]
MIRELWRGGSGAPQPSHFGSFARRQVTGLLEYLPYSNPYHPPDELGRHAANARRRRDDDGGGNLEPRSPVLSRRPGLNLDTAGPWVGAVVGRGCRGTRMWERRRLSSGEGLHARHGIAEGTGQTTVFSWLSGSQQPAPLDNHTARYRGPTLLGHNELESARKLSSPFQTRFHQLPEQPRAVAVASTVPFTATAPPNPLPSSGYSSTIAGANCVGCMVPSIAAHARFRQVARRRRPPSAQSICQRHRVHVGRQSPTLRGAAAALACWVLVLLAPRLALVGEPMAVPGTIGRPTSRAASNFAPLGMRQSSPHSSQLCTMEEDLGPEAYVCLTPSLPAGLVL